MIDDIFSDNLIDTHDIERVVEDGGDEQQNLSGAENNDDEENKNPDDKEKENDKSKPKRKLGPRVNLNVERLLGPRGIADINSFFSDIKLQGKKGTEKQDLKLIMSRLEHWAFRLMPRMEFKECLDKIEKLGTKKQVVNYMKRVRLGLEDDARGITSEEVVENEVDAFDELIADEPAPSTSDPVIADDGGASRDQVLRERIIYEDMRAVRLARAQELKRKFQESHAKKLDDSQSETLKENQTSKLTEDNQDTLQANHNERLQEMQSESVEENKNQTLIVNQSMEFQENQSDPAKNSQQKELFIHDIESHKEKDLGKVDLRAVRLARAQELKRKFQESQAKKCQGDLDTNVAKKSKETEEENQETLKANHNRRLQESQCEAVEINQNLTPVDNQSLEFQENQLELSIETQEEELLKGQVETQRENDLDKPAY